MSSIKTKSKSLAADMLSKGFKASKCKTALRLAIARIRLLKNRREVGVKQLRREVAKLLESGQEQTARIRVEHVIREEKTMAAYDLIEIYCELIVARMPIIESTKSCPIDLKEAIASVIFASPRCADIPELMDVRKIFTSKYGKEFVNSALEVRPDCGVSRLVVEKLSARAPDVETKMKTLAAIAQEHNIKWEPKAFMEEMQKPKEDILEGPATFSRSSWMPERSAYTKPPPTSQNSEAAKEFDAPIQARSDTSFKQNADIPIRSQSEPGVTVASPAHQGFDNSQSPSHNHPRWNMEFKDATAAAQAAAESAEQASRAARAAAELASHANIPVQASAGLDDTSRHHLGNQAPVNAQYPEHRAGNVVEDNIKEYNKKKTSPVLRQQNQSLHRDELVRGSSEGLPADYEGSRSRSSSKSSSVSDESSADENVPQVDFDLGTDMQHSRSQSFPVQPSQHRNSKHEDYGGRSTYDRNNSHFLSTNDGFINDYQWGPADQKSEDLGVKDRSTSLGERNSSSSHIKTAFDDSSDVHFDDYGSDDDNNGKNLLDKLLSGMGEESDPMPDQWSPKRPQSGSLDKVNSSELPSLVEVQHRQGADSENEDVIARSRVGTSLLRNFGRTSSPAEPRGVMIGSEKGTEGVQVISKVSSIGPGSPSFSNSYRDNDGADLSFNRTSGGKIGTDEVLSYTDKGLSYSRKGIQQHSLDSSDVYLVDDSKAKHESRSASSPSIPEDSGSSDSGGDQKQWLNLGRTPGGFRHRGLPPPPYVRSPDASVTSKQSSDDNPRINEKSVASRPKKSSFGFEFSYEDVNDAEEIIKLSGATRISNSSHTGAQFKENVQQEERKSDVRVQRTSFGKDNYLEESETDQAVRSRRIRDAVVSRPMRGFAAETITDQPETKSSNFTASAVQTDLSGTEVENNRQSHATRSSYLSSLRTRLATAETRETFKSLQQNTSKQPAMASSLNTEVSKSSQRAPPAVESKDRSKSLRNPNPSGEQPSVTSKFAMPKELLRDNSQESVGQGSSYKQESAGVSGEQPSRESSLKSTSHVHPKLPDYDSLAAHFQQIKANRKTG